MPLLQFVLISLFFLTPAKKWTDMDPRHIEDGPSWTWAALSALWTTCLMTIAISIDPARSPKLSVLVGGFAFGSAVGGCFTTTRHSKLDVKNCVQRWYLNKWEGFADGWYKLLFTIPLGWALGYVNVANPRYWAVGFIGLILAVIRVGIAMDSMRQTNDAKLYGARNKMLVRGSVFATMLLGVSALIVWLSWTRSIFDFFEPLEHFTLRDGIHIIGILMGVALSF